MSISKAEIKKIDAIKDEDIDTSDMPELGDWFWKNAKLEYPAKKENISIRIDKDVLVWFRALGKGYQSRINAILRTYMNANKSLK